MPNLSKQHLNFLGGEVSPRLHHRADLEQFGRWFAEAKNLRFHETGSFYNRPGFKHVAFTKNENPNDTVKLLSFSFNDEQSFLIELGSSSGAGYARFFKDGEPILVNSIPYEIASPFSNLEGQEIKYAQAGDILFLTNATYGIWELRRLKADGTEWEFKKFSPKTPPLDEINSDASHTLSLSNANIASIAKIEISLGVAEYVNEVFSPSFFIDDESVVSLVGITSWQIFIESINTYLSSNNYDFTAHLNENNIIFYNDNGEEVSFPSLKIVYSTLESDTIPLSVSPSDYGRNVVFHNSPRFGHSFVGEVEFFVPEGAYKVSSVYGSNSINLSDYGGGYSWTEFRVISDEQYQTVSSSIEDLASKNNSITVTSANSFKINTNVYINNDATKALWYNGPSAPLGTFNANAEVLVLLEKENTAEVETETSDIFFYLIDNNYGETIFSSNKVSAGDTLMVRNNVDAQEISETYSSGGPYVSSIVFGNGNWRCITSGNWVGSLSIEYSLNNKSTWNVLTKISSNSETIPNNMNESGSIEAEDSVYFRVKSSITSGSVNVDFVTSSYYTNSYYKIISIVDNEKAIVSPVKNHVGLFLNREEWFLPAFSDNLGYPSCIGFYQNRLFFGKGYMLYGSAVSDFWNFYRRGENIQDDDAMDMSLLSYKVNNIQNIVTQKKFFAFTEGAEFGIASEGAITQADKYLQQMSSHGSSSITPVLTGDIIVFIDKSRNTVRALKYSLESDSYEASDISIFLKQILQDEEFVDADFAYNQKECFFVTKSGKVFIMKYLPEQNILSWSHWEHGNGKIKSIRVVKNGYKDDIYAIVSSKNKMTIEVLTENIYLDSYVYNDSESLETSIQTSFASGTKVSLFDEDGRVIVSECDSSGIVSLPKALDISCYGVPYDSVATLLTPTVAQQDQTFSTYILSRPFKVHFFYSDSYGFKVGCSDGEKMQVEWQDVPTSIDDEFTLTSGHKSVLIPCRFGLENKVSFVQDQPFPMEVEDVLIDSDYGNK